MAPDRVRALAARPETRAAAGVLLSGVLVATIWLPPWRPWAIAFAFAPLLVAWLRATSWKQVLIIGLLCQWIISGIAFAWIAPSVRVYHDLSLPAALGCWLFAAAVTNLHIPLIGLGWWWVVRRHDICAVPASAILASAWVGLAQFYPTFVPFDYGYPWLWSGLPILHLADWVGFRGLAAVTLFVNALLAFAWIAPRAQERNRLGAYAALLLAVLNGIGFVHGREWEPGERSLRIALIQPSFGRDESLRAFEDPRLDAERVQTLLATSARAQAESPADLWIWPETSVLSPLGRGDGFDRWLTSLLATQAVPVLTGAHWSAGPVSLHNSAALFDRKGAIAGVYNKEHLFPFGEYIPLLSSLVDSTNRYVHYETPARPQTGVLTTEGVRLGLSICFESLFPDLFRVRADAGAQVFVNLSNDQPFGNTAERYQHLYMAMARAIELRRPLVRVAMSGASTVITRTGEVIAQGDMDRTWTRTVQVPFVENPPSTVFQRFGYLFEYACLLCTALVVLALELRLRNGARLRMPSLAAASRRRVGYAALGLLGLSQTLGVLTGSSTLQGIGAISGASPLPLVFGTVRGYEFWAGSHRLDLALPDGSQREVAIDSSVMQALPGPHRMHMLLAFPFMAGPIAPQALWRNVLEYELCNAGPLARAAGVPLDVRRVSVEVSRDAKQVWRAGVTCPQ